ncbi:partner of Y14 and mago-like isoform X2 [Gossypium australe]|uniref:Partner of Y14 and mago-like isoform X2 n=1 Tax=Gossypium australe TaxID=47621 RepID=A0A5B6WMB8_9ROSI|nr:partner of Y14 and mago-like isoform X2 [Gossypium australe]
MQWKKEMASQVGPPGYDPPTDTKLKTKSAKRNERKKEKRVQAALEKGKNLEAVADDEIKGDGLTEEDLDHGSESIKSLTSQMTDLAVSQNPVSTSPLSNSVDASDAVTPAQDLDKKIRALKKKIRLVEAQQQKTPQQDMKPEQLEKLAKLEGWREELKLLEDKKAEFAALVKVL